MTYEEFLKSKEIRTIESGFNVKRDELCPMLFDFQKDLVQWACRKGKAALLTGCGTGKSAMLLSWGECVYKHTNGDVLIIAPLSTVEQTRREAEKFHMMPVNICRTQEDVKHGLNITNYEMAEHFDHKAFIGVILDESSILNGFSSQTTKNMTDWFCDTPYKLLCTATISPNSLTEIGTSCEWLGIMKRYEMLATFFVHDSGTDKGNKWRLKRSAAKKFWEFMATWAICFINPKELDYEIRGYDLPPLNIQTIIVPSTLYENELVVIPALTLEERRLARKESIENRTNKVVELVQKTDSQVLIWVDYNDESAAIHKKIKDSVEIKGNDSPEVKAKASIDFAEGKIKTLVSKPSIFGFGSNFQNCNTMIFCGLSDSEERFYQAIRRCWRFGQEKQVNVYIIISERESNILANINRKEKQINEMQMEMTRLMKDTILSEIHSTKRQTTEYKPEKDMELPTWI